MRTKILALLVLAMTHSAAASAEPIRLKSAGSLKPALTKIVADFEAKSGIKVQPEFGSSGLMREKIEAGDPTDIFTSANLEHPQKLAQARGGSAQPFARNTLCALAQPGLGVTPDTLLVKMLDPAVKVGTSTPKADPAGDYAFALFDRADAVTPGTTAILKAKALQLSGGANSAKAPEGRTTYGIIMETKQADIFLTYCTNAKLAVKEVPGISVVAVPENLSVGADYGLIVLSAEPDARTFADYILSAEGQATLESFGFGAPIK